VLAAETQADEALAVRVERLLKADRPRGQRRFWA
jgi:hypothetical protein